MNEKTQYSGISSKDWRDGRWILQGKSVVMFEQHGFRFDKSAGETIPDLRVIHEIKCNTEDLATRLYALLMAYGTRLLHIGKTGTEELREIADEIQLHKTKRKLKEEITAKTLQLLFECDLSRDSLSDLAKETIDQIGLINEGGRIDEICCDSSFRGHKCEKVKDHISGCEATVSGKTYKWVKGKKP